MSKGTRSFQKKKKNADSASYSFTEPVVRVHNNKFQEKLRSNTIVTPRQKAGITHRITVFHKRKDIASDADVLGTRYVNAWRRSSGRSKSWRTCRRFRLTQDYLELLINSIGHPVSFGWQFYTANTPISLVRGRGLYVNKPSKSRKKRILSGISTINQIEEDNTPHWRLLEKPPRKKWPVRQDIQFPSAPEGVPKRLLRLNITHESFNITTEASLEGVRLTARQSLPGLNKKAENNISLKHFVVLHLVRNDSHADVYLVQKLSKSSQCYHAYAFLSEGLSKNGSTFIRRKADRLRKSHDFYAETIQSGVKIIIMKMAFNGGSTYNVKNTEREFPSLPGSVYQPRKNGQKKYRRSYAAVVAEEQPSKKMTKSNHIAYKNWQGRRGIDNPKKGKVTGPHVVADKKDAQSEVRTAGNEQKKIPKILLSNSFAPLLGTGLLTE